MPLRELLSQPLSNLRCIPLHQPRKRLKRRREKRTNSHCSRQCWRIQQRTPRRASPAASILGSHRGNRARMNLSLAGNSALTTSLWSDNTSKVAPFALVSWIRISKVTAEQYAIKSTYFRPFFTLQPCCGDPQHNEVFWRLQMLLKWKFESCNAEMQMVGKSRVLLGVGLASLPKLLSEYLWK